MNRKHPLLLALSAAMVMVHPHRLLLLKQQMPPPERMSSACCGSRKAHPSSIMLCLLRTLPILRQMPFVGRRKPKSSAATVTENLSRIRKSQENSLQPFSIAMPLIRAMMFPLEKTRIFSALQMLRISHPMPFPQFSGRMAAVCSLVRRNMFSLLRSCRGRGNYDAEKSNRTPSCNGCCGNSGGIHLFGV